ncbi:heavy-metal-associated domain-containing protein [Desulfovibrio ferrophilus]|uniref:Heavy metal transport/detoxification protein n=1 Tax=Desulfovibrio ferrophilus TaxID=241368 RepID=A0A2Z6AYU2_9BACT|nr:cation transporter [Desulfovibrio ferrophilus]BBD08353.1 heavy metal transport/detoxification protein [Desulfovibrio ferrophilus]
MKKLEINGMSCSHCTASVFEALDKIEGLRNIGVSLEDKCATFKAPDSVTEEQLKAAITAIGFEVGEYTED